MGNVSRLGCYCLCVLRCNNLNCFCRCEWPFMSALCKFEITKTFSICKGFILLRFCNNYFNKSLEATRHSLKNDSGFALMIFRFISFFESAQPAVKHGVSESKYFEQIPRRETYIITLISNVNLKCQYLWWFFKRVLVLTFFSLIGSVFIVKTLRQEELNEKRSAFIKLNTKLTFLEVAVCFGIILFLCDYWLCRYLV